MLRTVTCVFINLQLKYCIFVYVKLPLKLTSVLQLLQDVAAYFLYVTNQLIRRAPILWEQLLPLHF